MGHFHIDLIYFRIVEGGVDFDVAENTLDLFYWHTFVYGHSGEGSAEFVQRTIAQHCNGKCSGDLSSTPSLTFRGTISACGKKHSFSVPVEKATSSYRKAIETALRIKQ